jgi:hypothetical protein
LGSGKVFPARDDFQDPGRGGGPTARKMPDILSAAALITATSPIITLFMEIFSSPPATGLSVTMAPAMK